MTKSEAREQVGKFEFTVAVSEKKPDADQRVNALANWLLAEWDRVTDHFAGLRADSIKTNFHENRPE